MSTTNKNVTFSRSSVYEATYTFEDCNTGISSETNMFIKADTFEAAKNHLFTAVENNHIKILGYKIQLRTVWKMEDGTVPFSDLMPVICLKSSISPNRGVKGEKYFIKRSSIYMDSDGTAYGQLYNDNEGKKLMGQIRLDRFMSI